MFLTTQSHCFDEGLTPMAKHDDRIAKLYEQGRIHPRTKPADIRHPSPHRAANKCADHEETQANQAPEDQHSAGYNNDVGQKWTRGYGDPYPHFDRLNVWRGHELRDQIKDRPADHNRHHSEFERHNANGSVTHEQQAHDFSKRHIPQYERKLEMGGDNSQPVRRKYDQG